MPSMFSCFSWSKAPAKVPASNLLMKKSVAIDTSNSGLIFFPPFDPDQAQAPAPKTRGTDEFVRAIMIAHGGAQRAAFRAWSDIPLASEEALGRAKDPNHIPTSYLPPKKTTRQSSSKADRQPLSALGLLASTLAISPPSSPEPPRASSRGPPRHRYAHPTTTSLIPGPSQPLGHSRARPSTPINPHTLFGTSFPAGANTIPVPRERGLSGALRAIIHSIKHHPFFTSHKEISPPTLPELVRLHARYAAFMARQGRSPPPTGSGKPVTASSLAVVMYLWGTSRARATPVRIALGMVQDDVVAGEGYEAVVAVVKGSSAGGGNNKGKRKEGERVTVWIFFEGGVEAFDGERQAFTEGAMFRGMKPAAVAYMAQVGEISWRSRVKVLREVSPSS